MTYRWRRLQKTYEALHLRCSAILEGEGEGGVGEDERVAEEGGEVSCCSGSLDFSDSDFLSGEVIPRVPSDDDEVEEEDLSLIYGEYLAAYHPKIVTQPNRVRDKNSLYWARNVKSFTSKVDLFIW